MSLDITITFSAIISRDEAALLTDLPDWPTVRKLDDGERILANRLKRLGCVQIERSKDDPIQIWFDAYAGVTFVGRRAAKDGVVRIAP